MTITLRNTKGSALTHAEADANFSTLLLAAPQINGFRLTTQSGVAGSAV